MLCTCGSGQEHTGFNLLSHWRHGVPNEVLMDRGGLNVQGDNNRVFPQVQLEGVSCPATLGFHDVEWYPLEEVLESRPDPNTMSLQQLEACCVCSFPYPLQEFCLCEWAMGVCGLVRKEV